MMSARKVGRRSMLAGAAAVLAGCQQPGAMSILQANTVSRLGPGRIGYIALHAPIVDRSRDLFITNVNRLLALDAAEIHVPMTSPGGRVSAAQDMIAFMDKTHADRGVRFVTHNMGMIGSAACYVFLAGQRRMSVPRGTFVFHEVSLEANGRITSRDLQEASAQAQRIERSFLAMLTAKTKLTEGEATSFTRRTVGLNAEEARRDGIVHEIASLILPKDTTISLIESRPNATMGARQPEQGA